MAIPRGQARLAGAMTRPGKVVAAWDTGLSDFDIMTLTLSQVSGQNLRAVPERSGTVNTHVRGGT